MRNFIIFALAMVLLLAGVCAAQPTIVWQKCLGGSDWDEACSVQQTSDSGFIAAGYSNSNDGDVSGHHGLTDYSDYWVVKLNSMCDIVWQRSLGGSYDDWAYYMQQTTDGGFVVAGASWSNDGDVNGHHGTPGDSSDYWIVKLDSAGTIVWQKSLGGSSWDDAYSIQQTADGGFIIAGSSYSNDGDVSGHHGLADYPDYWIVKLNSMCDIVWQRSLGGSSYDDAYSIQQTADGGYIVAGSSGSNDGDVSGNHGVLDYWVVKLDSSGDIVWQKCLGGSGWDAAYSIQQTSDGGFVVAGRAYSSDGDVGINHGEGDYWIVRLDSSGDIVWQRSLGGTCDDRAWSIQQTTDDGFIVAGWSWSNDGDVSGHHDSTDYCDYWIVKLSSFGDFVWQRSLGGTSSDWATSIQQTSDGGFLVAGRSLSNDGDVSGNHGSSDYWVVKLSTDPIGISEHLTPQQFEITAFPNPFNSSCAITVNVGAEVEIYDLRGNVVHTMPVGETRRVAQQNGDAAHCPYIWQPDETIPSGIYLMRAKLNDGQTITKKIMYLK